MPTGMQSAVGQRVDRLLLCGLFPGKLGLGWIASGCEGRGFGGKPEHEEQPARAADIGHDVRRLVEGPFMNSMANEGVTRSGAPNICHSGYFLLTDGNAHVRGAYDSNDLQRLDERVRDARYLGADRAVSPGPGAGAIRAGGSSQRRRTRGNSQVTMERRVALEMLWLDPGEPLTHDRVRRAYLRRLRAHPPERDPEGFRRLREAFELLEPLARWTEHMAEAVPAREGPATRDPERAAQPGDGTREAMPVAVFTPPEMPDRPAPDLAPAHPAPATGGPPVAAGPSGERPSDGPDAPDPRDDREFFDEPWPDLRGEAVRPAPPVLSVDQPDEPPEPPSPTLGAVTDELLALLERAELDPALELADRWHHSALDDHREVSAHVAWRWALTRELLDVAPVLPSSLLRAIAHGIATDELASACEAAERYRAANPERARDLAAHFAKRAGNLHKVLGSRLQPRQVAPGAQRSARGHAPIWAAVLIASALARAATTCNRDSELSHQLDRLPAPAVPWSGSQGAPALDPNDPRIDPEHLKLDPETLRRLQKAIEPPPSQP